MSHTGTYRDPNGLLPTDEEVIKKCIEVNTKIQEQGLKVHCGHDFWEKAQKMEYGEVVHCTRCNQFFVKTKVLVWLTANCYNSFAKKPKDRTTVYGSNHLADTIYVPYPIRMTSES